jgi:hypothetical protein
VQQHDRRARWFAILDDVQEAAKDIDRSLCHRATVPANPPGRP